MPPTQSAPLVSVQAPKDVSLSQIEAELSQIWQMYNAANQDGGGGGATRAATFTLIVYEPEETQDLLSSLGFYQGPIDGIMGPQMEAALKAAQKAFGLSVDSKPSPELLNRLRAEVANQRSHRAENSDDGTPQYAPSGAGAIADAIASQNPCRIISLLPSAGEDAGINAQVSAYCPIQKRSQSTLICCEYITLKGTDTAADRLSSLVGSLVIADLPKFLWWKASPDPSIELLRKLGGLCNSVIVDSSAFQEPHEELLKLLSLMADGIRIADLNWSRLAAWQELAAEAFDPPERRASLKQVDRVTIDYEKGNSAQALMYLGWLASRLQWTPVSYTLEMGGKSDYDIHHLEFVTHDQRQVKAELGGVPVLPGAVIGDLIGLRLDSTDPAAACTTILCSETTGCMRMEAGGAAQSARIRQVSSLADQRAETLLGQQLQRWGQDSLYEESMELTAQILRLRG
ncbi:MAG TPA: glucose-6-phosphate dehydrogenase assembly protein OpcA [Thermosynechococcaceae cyanobacterium]